MIVTDVGSNVFIVILGISEGTRMKGDGSKIPGLGLHSGLALTMFHTCLLPSSPTHPPLYFTGNEHAKATTIKLRTFLQTFS